MNVPSPSAVGDKPRHNTAASAFWRAMRFLRPHSGIVSVSIICAIFTGLTLTGGLGTLLPILRIIVYGDTVQGWVTRAAVEQRLGIKLAEDPDSVTISKIESGSSAQKAGLRVGDVISTAAGAKAGDTLWTLSDPNVRSIRFLMARGPSATVDLPKQRFYINWFRSIAHHVPAHPVKALAVVLGFVLFLTLLGNFARFFQEYLSDKAAILAVNDLRRQLYDHVLHIPLSFFGLKGTSDVTSRLVQDAQGLQDGFKTVLGQSIQEPIKAAMAFALALWLDWHLTLFIVCFAPLAFWILKRFGRKMRRASRRALQSSSSMLGQLEGTLIGLRVVKASAAERFERRRYTRIMGDLVKEQLHMSRIDATTAPTLETLTFIVVALVVLYATYLVRITRSLDATAFMGLMACLVSIGESLRRCSKVNNSLQKATAAAMRIFELLDVPVERRRMLLAHARGKAARTAPPASLRPIGPVQREVRFENITFTYPSAVTPALNGVSFSVTKGHCVAIVGRNGSGKTTLMSLLPRFYHPDAGRILIDDVDIQTATLRSVRRQIGIVTQESVIFPTTIRQNIRYGQPLASDQQVIAAAKKAFVHDFILERAQGYDTPLGEHGLQLSGGQRQRLCIARAILRQTPILILDEATSQVDAESEHLIQQAIESLMHERTTFVIAHRFSTILSADRIMVMDRGRIVGEGRHDELLQNCATYQQLYERQISATPTDNGAITV